MGQNRPVGARIHLGRMLALALVWGLLAGCGSHLAGKVSKAPDLPRGVHLSDPGSTREVGKSATVMYRLEDEAASAMTVSVTRVRRGSLGYDFQFFNLPEAVKNLVPFYVSLQVKNRGPSGMGGVALPLSLTTDKSVYAPTQIVGDLPPCSKRTLPKSFLPGKKVDICLVYLVGPGETPKSVDVRTGTASEAVHVLVQPG